MTGKERLNKIMSIMNDDNPHKFIVMLMLTACIVGYCVPWVIVVYMVKFAPEYMAIGMIILSVPLLLMMAILGLIVKKHEINTMQKADKVSG